MKKLSVMTAVVLAIGFLVSSDALAGRVGNRAVKQQARIHQGVRSGELTVREVGGLQREQARLRKDTRRAWSDEHLSGAERLRLEREQDRASRHIYRLKHNDADR